MSRLRHLSSASAAGAPVAERLAPYVVIEIPSAGAARLRVTGADGAEAGATVDGPEPLVALQALTPRLMRWSEDLWILDLESCASYWRARAENLGLGVTALLRRMIQGMFPGQPVRAAMAEHPWTAVLLAGHMRERHLSGLVIGSGAFGENLFRELSWDNWWQAADALAEQLAGTERRPRFNPAVFRRQCQQMRRAVRRLGLPTPWHLRTASALAIKRRFGATLHDMWTWTYQGAVRPPSERSGGQDRELFTADGCLAAPGLPPHSAAAALFASGFPWRSHVFAGQPQIRRDLDHPLAEWAHLEPLLREDLDRLIDQPSWLAGELAVSLEWRLVLDDLSRLIVPIQFRHPHSLPLERGSHPTALLQALYAFERARRDPARFLEHDLVRDRDDLELVRRRPVITGWELALTGRLTLPPRCTGLFGEALTATGEAMDSAGMAVLALENRLPVPLESFELRADWLPEDSFGSGTGGGADGGTGQAAHHEALKLIARDRPLLLYRTPTPYDSRGRSSAWRFTERTMAKWWRTPAAAEAQADLQRDYYRLMESGHRTYWVFRNPNGRWFIHGVFA